MSILWHMFCSFVQKRIVLMVQWSSFASVCVPVTRIQMTHTESDPFVDHLIHQLLKRRGSDWTFDWLTNRSQNNVSVDLVPVPSCLWDTPHKSSFTIGQNCGFSRHTCGYNKTLYSVQNVRHQVLNVLAFQT